MLGLNRCGWTRNRLPLLAGDELAGEERRRVERHLLACPNCRASRDSMRSAVTLLKIAARDDFPGVGGPPLWPDVARRIRESRHDSPRRLAFLGLPAAGLAAGLLAAAGSAWYVANASKSVSLADSSVPASQPRRALPDDLAASSKPADLDRDRDREHEHVVESAPSGGNRDPKRAY